MVEDEDPATRPFPRYLTASTLSLYGDWFSTVAIVVLLLQLTGSSAAPAAYMLARVVPRLAGAAVGGELADRLAPQRVAAALAAVQGLLMASIIVSAERHLVWSIYAAVAVSQLLGATARPALLALLPRLVVEHELSRANGLVSAAMSSSQVVAPALSVPLLAIFHRPELLIGIDAASFALAALLFASLPAGGRAAAGPLRGATAGLRVIWADGHLRSLAGAYLGGALAVTTASAVLVLAAADRFGGADRVGALYAAVGAGALLGSTAAMRRGTTRVLRSTLVVGALAEIVLLAVLTLAQGLATAALPLAASAAAGSLYQVWGSTELQLRAPAEVLGRAGAALVLAQYVGMLLGAVLAAALVPLVGWDRALFAACSAALAAIAASVTGPLRQAAPRPVV
ncbi:MAG: transporter [Chloroflexi bacterium]|nr:transporter [Chloroflexota bacterium]